MKLLSCVNFLLVLINLTLISSFYLSKTKTILKKQNEIKELKTIEETEKNQTEKQIIKVSTPFLTKGACKIIKNLTALYNGELWTLKYRNYDTLTEFVYYNEYIKEWVKIKKDEPNTEDIPRNRLNNCILEIYPTKENQEPQNDVKISKKYVPITQDEASSFEDWCILDLGDIYVDWFDDS